MADKHGVRSKLEAGRQLARDFARPHYLFRPRQLLHRLFLTFEDHGQDRVTCLPWGQSILSSPRETIGLAIARRGIYDAPVSEVLMRLADEGETAVDVGANIGHMTSLLSCAVGSTGKVISFEPHPSVYKRLTANVAQWSSNPSGAPIETYDIALSDSEGESVLSSDHFATNQGSSTLERQSQDVGDDVHRVRTCRLDAMLTSDISVGVLKIDVEGHELSALSGASALLTTGRIRDIVFEEKGAPPTPVTALLESHGYSIFHIDERFNGLVATPLAAVAGTALRARDEPNLLATLAPDRALARLSKSGWAVFHVGPARVFAPPK